MIIPYIATRCSDNSEINIYWDGGVPLDISVPYVLNTDLLECYTLVENPGYTGQGITINIDDIAGTYADCAECIEACYKLTDCANNIVPVMTEDDLSTYDGSVVSWDDSGTERCATVSLGLCIEGKTPTVIPPFTYYEETPTDLSGTIEFPYISESIIVPSEGYIFQTDSNNLFIQVWDISTKSLAATLEFDTVESCFTLCYDSVRNRVHCFSTNGTYRSIDASNPTSFINTLTPVVGAPVGSPRVWITNAEYTNNDKIFAVLYPESTQAQNKIIEIDPSTMTIVNSTPVLTTVNFIIEASSTYDPVNEIYSLITYTLANEVQLGIIDVLTFDGTLATGNLESLPATIAANSIKNIGVNGLNYAIPNSDNLGVDIYEYTGSVSTGFTFIGTILGTNITPDMIYGFTSYVDGTLVVFDNTLKAFIYFDINTSTVIYTGNTSVDDFTRIDVLWDDDFNQYASVIGTIPMSEPDLSITDRITITPVTPPVNPIGIQNGITIIDTFQDCSGCSTIEGSPEYRLISCEDSQNILVIKWAGATMLDPDTVYTFDFGGSTCWTAEFTVNDTAGVPIYGDNNITNEFEDCASCNQVCYRLIDCALQEPDVLTSDIVMQDYVGQIIKWADEFGTIRCATVVTFLCREEDAFVNADITIIACLKNCTTCLESLEPVIEEVPSEFTTIRRRIKPNFVLAVCSLEKYRDTQCKFSEAVYQQMASKRYGIEFCCDIDLDKYSVKAELMNLQILENTDWSDDTLSRCTDAVGIGNMQINNDSCNVFRVYPETE